MREKRKSAARLCLWTAILLPIILWALIVGGRTYLRHSFASIANEAGTPMSEISSAMGHSNIGVTHSIYTHEFTETKHVAVNAVAQKIAAAKGATTA